MNQLKGIPYFASLILIAYLSLNPKPESPPFEWIFSDFIPFDLFAHAICYMGATILGLWGLPRRAKWILIGTFFWGIAMEFGQSFIPGRFPDFFDVLANGIGILISLGICFGVKRWKKS